MNARRITEITVETFETVTIRQSGRAPEVRCSQCGSPALALAQDTAAGLFWTRLREICGDSRMKQIHLAKTADGSTIVCLDSLQKSTQHLLGNSQPQMNETKENAS